MMHIFKLICNDTNEYKLIARQGTLVTHEVVGLRVLACFTWLLIKTLPLFIFIFKQDVIKNAGFK